MVSFYCVKRAGKLWRADVRHFDGCVICADDRHLAYVCNETMLLFQAGDGGWWRVKRSEE